jgi:hypothetical protein
MKELFNTLSIISEFFNEKRFIYQQEGAQDVKHDKGDKPNNLSGDTKDNTEGLALEELDIAKSRLARVKEGSTTVMEFNKNQQRAAEKPKTAGILGMMGADMTSNLERPSDKSRKRLIERLRKGGNEAKMGRKTEDTKFFTALSKRATSELAKRGNPSGPGPHENPEVVDLIDKRRDASSQIAKDINENGKQEEFLGLLADLQLAKKGTVDEDVVYNQMAELLYKINPRTVKTFLPSLHRTSTFFAGTERRDK